MYAKMAIRNQFLKCLEYFSKFPLIGSIIASLHGNLINMEDVSQYSNFHKHVTFEKPTKVFPSQTLVFHLEGALLKSSSLFPYFMLVAFEAGGILRAFVLLLTYPLICMVEKEMQLKIMVFVCFLGIKEDRFRIGTSVLPKHFLEDVGVEGFDMLMTWGSRKVVVSDMPRIMVEGFLKDYLGMEVVVGRELRVSNNGYFLGLLDGEKTDAVLDENFKETGRDESRTVGVGCMSKFVDHITSTYCKEVYRVKSAEKKNWKTLPRERYPRPLIFHDGRLAFRPTAAATLALFIYIPLGFILFLVRFIFAWVARYRIFYPVIAFSGMRTRVSFPNKYMDLKQKKPNGTIYVCNHKTLIDPVYISYTLGEPTNLAAVTYSVSKINEMLSGMKTVRLKRDREEDKRMIGQMLQQNDLVICPEGTTCREDYLLRFSPLFAEMSDDIVPVAIDMDVGTFYGSTASGLKVFDPGFHLLNPCPTYHVKVLEKVPSWCSCVGGKKTNIEVANYVQGAIAEALGFECTNLTRREKYMILAGNSGDM